jgi:TRAP-type mannitol/chloroaromatic compound transport system permease small subunit
VPGPIRAYVRIVDRLSRAVGLVAMYIFVLLMGMLLWSSAVRLTTGTSYVWVVEMAEFTMVAYYMLGGAHSLQLDSHVRMDLFYSHWSERSRAIVDAITILLVIGYAILLLRGGISSTIYALQYGQKNYSAWAPYLWPVKTIMVVGIFLVLLQLIATFFKDLAKARGESLE